MGTLAAIGRAQPSRSLERVVNTKLNIEAGERADRALNSTLALQGEQLNKLRVEREYYQKMSAQRPWETGIGSTFYGGPNGKVSQWALKKMSRMGLITNVNGVPSYTGYGAEKAGKELFTNKDMQIQLLTTIHSAAKSDLDQARQILSEKPNDKNALQQAKTAAEALDDANIKLDQLSKAWKTQEEKEAEASDADRRERETVAKETTAEARMISATRESKSSEKGFVTWMNPKDHSQTKNLRIGERPPEGWVKYSKDAAGSKSPEQKQAESWKKDYQEYWEKSINAYLGTGTFFKMEADVRQKAARDAIAKAKTIARQYVKAGNEIRDLGIASVGELNSLASLPEGLTEDIIQHNQEIYGWTLQETIDNFNKLKKLQAEQPPKS